MKTTGISSASTKISTSPIKEKDPTLDWKNFYKEFLGLDVDFSGTTIPRKPRTETNWRLIFIPKNLTIAFAYGEASKLFKVEDTDENFDAMLQNMDGSKNFDHYAVWVIEDWTEIRIDEKGYMKPRKNRRHITLLERIIWGMKYHVETERYIDTNGFEYCETVCAGTRTKKQLLVPCVGFHLISSYLGLCMYIRLRKLNDTEYGVYRQVAF